MRFSAAVIPGIVGLLLLTGCQTWQTVDDPVRLIAEERPERVRVTRQDGVRLVLEAPEIRAGAVVATAAPGAVLLENIRTMEVRAASVTRTAAFLLPGGILLAIIANKVSGL